jgi:hypothetical protein
LAVYGGIWSSDEYGERGTDIYKTVLSEIWSLGWSDSSVSKTNALVLPESIDVILSPLNEGEALFYAMNSLFEVSDVIWGS